MSINFALDEEVAKAPARTFQELKAMLDFLAFKLVTAIDGRIKGGTCRLVPVVHSLTSEEEEMIFVQIRQSGHVLNEIHISVDSIWIGTDDVTMGMPLKLRRQGWTDLAQCTGPRSRVR